MKRNLLSIGLFAGALTLGAATLPDVSGVTMVQDADRTVRVGYTLAHGPAIVTLAVETNAPGGAWLPAGGRLTATALGDVNRVVEDGAHAIAFAPDRDFPDGLVGAGAARAVVTAWPVDDPPDYLAVDLSPSANVTSRVRYYPDAESVPGGVVSNVHYRLSTLLLRRMHARGRTWMMGAVAPTGRGTTSPRSMTLAEDYYVGVFEVTHAQWAYVAGTNNLLERAYSLAELHPAGNVSYLRLRENANGTGAARDPDAVPGATSFLGKLRARTGIAFDLPTDAEWEFAAKGGQGDGHWGDGSPYLGTDVDANLPGVYSGNSGVPVGEVVVLRTRPCGQFAPNAYGLYDMHGNNWEWARDSAWPDIDAATKRVVRGGGKGHNAQNCRASVRVGVDPGRGSDDYGARVRCPIDIRTGFDGEVAQ